MPGVNDTFILQCILGDVIGNTAVDCIDLEFFRINHAVFSVSIMLISFAIPHHSQICVKLLGSQSECFGSHGPLPIVGSAAKQVADAITKVFGGKEPDNLINRKNQY